MCEIGSIKDRIALSKRYSHPGLYAGQVRFLHPGTLVTNQYGIPMTSKASKDPSPVSPSSYRPRKIRLGEGIVKTQSRPFVPSRSPQCLLCVLPFNPISLAHPLPALAWDTTRLSWRKTECEDGAPHEYCAGQDERTSECWLTKSRKIRSQHASHKERMSFLTKMCEQFQRHVPFHLMKVFVSVD